MTKQPQPGFPRVAVTKPAPAGMPTLVPVFSRRDESTSVAQAVFVAGDRIPLDATDWQERVLPRTRAFIVELPAGKPSVRDVGPYVSALHRLAE